MRLRFVVLLPEGRLLWWVSAMAVSWACVAFTNFTGLCRAGVSVMGMSGFGGEEGGGGSVMIGCGRCRCVVSVAPWFLRVEPL